MACRLTQICAEFSDNLNIILMFGLVVFGGTLGARISQRYKIPQVIGCIVVGILLGDCLKLITPHTIERLEPFMMFALGIIGFVIGSELRGDVFKKYGRQFFIILFSQGIGAFLLVGIGCTALAFFLQRSCLARLLWDWRLVLLPRRRHRQRQQMFYGSIKRGGL